MNKLEYVKIKKSLEKYFKQEKYIDEQFIYDTIELIVKYRKFNSMIDNINVSNKSIEKGTSSFYSPVEKTINIVLPDKDVELFDYNTTILHILLHELEHVDQHKKCLERKNNTLETDLLSTCFKANNYLETIQKRLCDNEIKQDEYFSIIQQMQYYKMYSEIVNKGCYELLPSERQAEINSFRYMIDLLKNIKNDQNKDKIEKIKLNYIIRKMMGYKKEDNSILAPTYELYRIILDFMNQPELLTKYYEIFDSSSKNMSLEQRLYYGLIISSDEYDRQILDISKRLIK